MRIMVGLQEIEVRSRADHERLVGPLDTPAAPKPAIDPEEWRQFQAAKAAGEIPKAAGEAA
jgi:hypothetical protein